MILISSINPENRKGFKIRSQEEYDEYLAAHAGIQEGFYVRSKFGNSNTEHMTLYSLDYVIKVNKDLDSITSFSHDMYPEGLVLCPVPTSEHSKPYFRNTVLHNYIAITNEQVEHFINDRIRNYFKEIVEARKAAQQAAY